MSDGRRPQEPTPPQDADSGPPIAPEDVASAGRSCLVIVVLAIAVVLVLCIGIAVRWASVQ